MVDHERIWLEPEPGADEEYGRQWCQHNVWGDEATEYVRTDLEAALASPADVGGDHVDKALAWDAAQASFKKGYEKGKAETLEKIAELEAALDEKEIASGLTTNGNLWRFWSTKARDVAVRNAELEKALETAREALEPFAYIAGEAWVDETGWTGDACKDDRICDWFGPSDFFAAHRAILTLSLSQKKEG